MGSLSIWHWLVVILVVVLLFGRNKISDLMGDVARGVKSFKKGLADDDEAKSIEEKPAVTVDVEASREKTKAG
jgi:sec-independent protein translocase protein TatA